MQHIFRGTFSHDHFEINSPNSSNYHLCDSSLGAKIDIRAPMITQRWNCSGSWKAAARTKATFDCPMHDNCVAIQSMHHALAHPWSAMQGRIDKNTIPTLFPSHSCSRKCSDCNTPAIIRTISAQHEARDLCSPSQWGCR